MAEAADRGLLRSWELHLRSIGRSPRTIELYLKTLGGFTKWLTDHGRDGGLLAVRRADVTEWLAGLRDAGLSENTVRNRWIALRSLYRWLVEEEEIAENPLARINVTRPETPPPDVLRDEDLRALLRACQGKDFKDRRDYAIIRLLAGTGMRLAECASLQEADIDLMQRLVVIHKGKGGKTRIVRIDSETASAIDRYLRVRARHRCAGLPDLWIGHRGRFGSKGIQAIVPQRAEMAGLGHVHVHQLRHSYAHRFLERGGTEGDLQLLGGWEDPKVMRRYGSALAADRALAAADRIDVLGGL